MSVTSHSSTHQSTARAAVVLDTSVLMADPDSFQVYGHHDIVLPLTVIDELDSNKTRTDDAGRNTRHVLAHLEEIRRSHVGLLSSPVPLPGGGTLRIEPNGLKTEKLKELHLDTRLADHRIIAAALGVAETVTDVTLISNDAALRIKASLVGLQTSEHTPGKIGELAPVRGGLHTLSPSYATLEEASHRQPFNLVDLPGEDQALFEPVLDNEFVLVEGTSLIVRRAPHGVLRPLNSHQQAWGSKARNKEQACALDLLCDPDVALVALRGRAGTGKTLLAIAAGLEAVIEKKTHDQLMILRPMISVGREDLGFLPGDIAEKTAPWFAAVVDAVVALSGGKTTFAQAQEQLSLFVERRQLVMEPITFLRGRSLNRVFAILDEAQNTEPSTVKTVISRMGAGSKLVLTGDPEQRDSPWVGEKTNGLSVTVDAFAGEDLFGQVHLTRGERSRLADLAAEKL